MGKTLFHRSERDVIFETNERTKYTKVTVSTIMGIESIFYLSDEFIEEVAYEVDRAKRCRIANKVNL